MSPEFIDYFLAHCQDVPVASIELDGGDGILVGIPGSVWADEYVTIWLHERDCTVTRWDEEDGSSETDRLQVPIPLERLGELRAAIDKAEARLIEQRQTQNWDWIK